MNALAAFDEKALRRASNPAISADAIRWRDVLTERTVSASVSDECFLRPSDDLFRIVESSRGGRHINGQAISQALALLDALPAWVPPPEIVVESDGQIGFDWQVTGNLVLSLNVGVGGMIGYAALNGLESSYGRLPFAGVLPARIRDLLHITMQERHASRHH